MLPSLSSPSSLELEAHLDILESHGQRSLVGCSLWELKESNTTEQRTLSFGYFGLQEKGLSGSYGSCSHEPLVALPLERPLGDETVSKRTATAAGKKGPKDALKNLPDPYFSKLQSIYHALPTPVCSGLQ